MDLSRFNLLLTNTIKLIMGRTIIIMLDYETVRDMNMNGVGQQYLRVIRRFKRLYKREINCVLFCPYIKDI